MSELDPDDNGLCLACGCPLLSSASRSDTCRDCHEILAAQHERVAAFRSYLDPNDPQVRVIEIRQLEFPARPDYYMTGAEVANVIALFSVAQLAGLGFITDVDAAALAEAIGNIPESAAAPTPAPEPPVTAVPVSASAVRGPTLVIVPEPAESS